MARGRFISNGIISDKKINELSDDTSRLAFTWLITTADAEGRTHGDPAMVRSILFPRRADVTVERMEAYISEWASCGLIRWYESNDDLWIDFPNFEKHQTGLRKEREPASQIPPHIDGTEHKSVTEVIRQTSGKHPAQIKLREGNDKLKESLSPDGESETPKNEPEVKPLTPRQAATSALEIRFSSLSGLPLPKRDTEKDKKAGASRWWNPLAEIWEMCGKDTDKAAQIIEKAYRKMKADELTISAPQSVLEVAKSVYAQNGHKSSTPSSMTGYQKVSAL